MARKPELSRKAPRSMLGMSLVEIMVATAVGLIGVTMIMQVYAVAEGQKRTTTGTSDAQISGNIALFNIERDLRYAGFGMVTNAGNMLGCVTLAYDSLRPANQEFSFEMAPVVITAGALGAPDTIRVIYGNPLNVVEGALFGAAATSDADFPLKNAAGFAVGGLVVPYLDGQQCVVAEVTGFVAASVNTIKHESGAAYSYTDQTGTVVNKTAHHNKAGGLGAPLPSYTTVAKLYAMGRNPVVRTYLVSGGNLKTETQLPYVAAQDPDGNGVSDAEIATGIVQMKAVYGKDTDGNLVVETWNATKPINAAEWMQVRAVKVAILARSGLYEKIPVYGPPGCTAACTSPSTGAPSWRHPTGGPTLFLMSDLADGTDWRNYRYRVYETTVPLRNMIWSNDP